MNDRVEKLNSFFYHELTELCARELEIPSDALLSITRVDISGGLESGTVYISVLPKSKEEEVVSILKRDWKKITHLLAKKTSFLRRLPHLMFEIDKEAAKIYVVEEIITKINKPETRKKIKRAKK